MPYRVLARAYRSRTFDEVVGQETIAATLKNAIQGGRVHHGYLFTGTRGVGKTSMARILAKALNCLAADAPTTTPCCACDSCAAVATGEDVDVVEIDAASNTGVDNIRDLRGNATLRPARARFKIYIIDEVHMLSAGAFNALLKTLEEPPDHVKFILATTESHKVPLTIQSRCQRFDFRAVEAADIARHLAHIAEREGVAVDEAALRRVARLAQGSMRDALSLLDKLISYSPDRVTTTAIDELIPPSHDERAEAVFRAAAAGDAAAALTALDRALQSGRTVDRFSDQLIEHARALMLVRVCGADTELVDVPAGARQSLAEAAKAFDAPTYVYMISLLEELRRAARSSGAARALADAVVVRLAISRQFTDVETLLHRLESRGEPDLADASKKKRNDDGRPVGQSRDALRERGPEVDAAAAPRDSADAMAAGQARIAETSDVAGRPSTAEGGSFQDERRRPVGDVVTSEAFQRAARDPLVVRVVKAVDGSIKSVRRIEPAGAPVSRVREEAVGPDARAGEDAGE